MGETIGQELLARKAADSIASGPANDIVFTSWLTTKAAWRRRLAGDGIPEFLSQMKQI